jgi:uncharacterized SAM-binding protein YcdF (DUF218 family)
MMVLGFLKAVAVSLLLPPFGFVTLAALAMLLVRNPRARTPVLVFSLIGLVLLAMPAVADTILAGLETHLTQPTTGSPPPQAIIVLGAEVRRTREAPGVVVGPLSLERLASAARLQRKTGLPVLISGGTMQSDIHPIADVMADSMRDDFQVGVRWRETRSLTTWENARFSAEILKKEGITSVYVVTHAWHMRRALLAFHGLGLTVTPAPTPPERREGAVFEDFVPHASTWVVSYYALHEWIGYAWYALR